MVVIISRDCHRNQFNIVAKQKKYGTGWKTGRTRENVLLYVAACAAAEASSGVFVFVQGTRSANEVVILTVHDIGCDREYIYYYDCYY